MQDFTHEPEGPGATASMIDRATAFEVAPNAEALKMALKGIEIKEPGIL